MKKTKKEKKTEKSMMVPAPKDRKSIKKKAKDIPSVPTEPTNGVYENKSISIGQVFSVLHVGQLLIAFITKVFSDPRAKELTNEVCIEFKALMKQLEAAFYQEQLKRLKK